MLMPVITMILGGVIAFYGICLGAYAEGFWAHLPAVLIIALGALVTDAGIAWAEFRGKRGFK